MFFYGMIIALLLSKRIIHLIIMMDYDWTSSIASEMNGASDVIHYYKVVPLFWTTLDVYLQVGILVRIWIMKK